MTEDTKNENREPSSVVNHRVYHLQKECDVMHTKLNIKSKFPKRDENIKMSDIYHIQCDPDLGLGKCAMRRIPCVCQS